MTQHAERGVRERPVAERTWRRVTDRPKRAGTAAIAGGILSMAGLAADTFLSGTPFYDTTRLAYHLDAGALFVGSVLLLVGLLGAYRHHRLAGRFGTPGLILSAAGFALVSAGGVAQFALAALGRVGAAELAGFVLAAGLLVGLVGSLPLGVAFLRGSGGTLARIGGVALLASLPSLVVSLEIAETSVALAVLASVVYPFAWVVLGYSLRTGASRRDAVAPAE